MAFQAARGRTRPLWLPTQCWGPGQSTWAAARGWQGRPPPGSCCTFHNLRPRASRRHMGLCFGQQSNRGRPRLMPMATSVLGRAPAAPAAQSGAEQRAGTQPGLHSSYCRTHSSSTSPHCSSQPSPSAPSFHFCNVQLAIFLCCLKIGNYVCPQNLPVTLLS